MKNFSLLFIFLSSFSFGQCSLEISDTTHSNCFGDNSGALEINVIDAVKPYFLSLSNGAISVNGSGFSNLSAGNYEIILTDADLCTYSIQIKIKEPSLLTLNLKCV